MLRKLARYTLLHKAREEDAKGWGKQKRQRGGTAESAGRRKLGGQNCWAAADGRSWEKAFGGVDSYKALMKGGRAAMSWRRQESLPGRYARDGKGAC